MPSLPSLKRLKSLHPGLVSTFPNSMRELTSPTFSKASSAPANGWLLASAQQEAHPEASPKPQPLAPTVPSAVAHESSPQDKRAGSTHQTSAHLRRVFLRP